MPIIDLVEDSNAPEAASHRLSVRLRRHKLLDFILLFSPPLLAVCYLAFALFFRDLVPLSGLAAAGVVIVVAALAMGSRWRRSWKHLSASFAAGLIDRQVGGQDRFMTLATLPASSGSSDLFARLRAEAAGLLGFLDVRKNFSYRFKSGFFFSLTGSFAAVLVFHLLLQMLLPAQPHAAALQELSLLAERLSQVPALAQLGQKLQAAAQRIDEPDLSTDEKLAAVQKIREELEARAKELKAPPKGKQQQRGGEKDLVDQTADALEKIEKGLKGEREDGERVGLKIDLPDPKSTEGNAAKGGGGERKGDAVKLGNQELKDGKSSDKPPGSEELSKKPNDKDKSRQTNVEQEKERESDTEGGAKGSQEGKGREGRNQSAEIPKGPAPERFQKPGEGGPGGIKGSRFVLVELPDTVESSSSSESEAGEGPAKKIGPSGPISNVPLPRSSGPQASPEKQPVPLEYRGLIR